MTHQVTFFDTMGGGFHNAVCSCGWTVQIKPKNFDDRREVRERVWNHLKKAENELR